jgi:hypothetical protein
MQLIRGVAMQALSRPAEMREAWLLRYREAARVEAMGEGLSPEQAAHFADAIEQSVRDLIKSIIIGGGAQGGRS